MGAIADIATSGADALGLKKIGDDIADSTGIRLDPITPIGEATGWKDVQDDFSKGFRDATGIDIRDTAEIAALLYLGGGALGGAGGASQGAMLAAQTGEFGPEGAALTAEALGTNGAAAVVNGAIMDSYLESAGLGAGLSSGVGSGVGSAEGNSLGKKLLGATIQGGIGYLSAEEQNKLNKEAIREAKKPWGPQADAARHAFGRAATAYNDYVNNAHYYTDPDTGKPYAKTSGILSNMFSAYENQGLPVLESGDVNGFKTLNLNHIQSPPQPHELERKSEVDNSSGAFHPNQDVNKLVPSYKTAQPHHIFNSFFGGVEPWEIHYESPARNSVQPINQSGRSYKPAPNVQMPGAVSAFDPMGVNQVAVSDDFISNYPPNAISHHGDGMKWLGFPF